jgi:prepilin-type N-terminal cleavage/methylation domain-containing protein/prepilin-type processing-associated H-X9-DG protein
MRASSPRGRGFTLIELMVVLAIIGVLLALLLAAIQRAREAASRAACLSNLRQVGLALQHFHDDNRAFPPGVSSPGRSNPYPWIGWHARILPYVENAPLWATVAPAFAINPDFRINPPHVAVSTVIPVYICPSDPRSDFAHAVPTFPSFVAAYTDYLGNEGINLQRQEGVLYLDSHTRLTDIKDGTSNTLLVGERPPSPDGWLGWWYGGWGQNFTDGSANGVLGVREKNVYFYGGGCPVGPYEYGPGRLDNLCDVFHFWSLHIGGANFLFADGSVHFLPYSVSPKIMHALATRAGGEAVPALDY